MSSIIPRSFHALHAGGWITRNDYARQIGRDGFLVQRIGNAELMLVPPGNGMVRGTAGVMVVNEGDYVVFEFSSIDTEEVAAVFKVLAWLLGRNMSKSPPEGVRSGGWREMTEHARFDFSQALALDQLDAKVYWAKIDKHPLVFSPRNEMSAPSAELFPKFAAGNRELYIIGDA